MSISENTEARICFVNCGLPGEQCACFRAQMAAIYSGLLARQEPPDPEMDRIYFDNLDLLYEN